MKIESRIKELFGGWSNEEEDEEEESGDDDTVVEEATEGEEWEVIHS
jgi:hypothetical protein